MVTFKLIYVAQMSLQKELSGRGIGKGSQRERETNLSFPSSLLMGCGGWGWTRLKSEAETWSSTDTN